MTMISTNCTTAPCTAPTQMSVLARLRHFRAVWSQRQALKSLDSAVLRDIGVTRAQADAEAGRPIWDAPENWRC